jgi:uncharacterized protein YdbL (DUF1318 family)
MIKVRTIGGIDKVIVNPVLKSTADVVNYTFIADADGDVYLVTNTLVGDDAYREGVVFAKGEYLNGYLVKSLAGLELVADEKHIAYAEGADYDDITAGTTLMTVNENGKLAVAQAAPASGVYFKVTEKCRLTEKAVVIKVIVADKDTVYTPPISG